MITGVPVEERMFACAFGFYWSTVYEHFTWKKVPDHHVPGTDGKKVCFYKARLWPY